MTDPQEEIRWKLKRYTFGADNIEEFERKRGPWLGEGRNHGTWENEHGRVCLQREERESGLDVEVQDENVAALKALVEGRRIVKFDREPSSKDPWPDSDNSVEITLDNGAKLSFYGWGYDASGLSTSYHPPKED